MNVTLDDRANEQLKNLKSALDMSEDALINIAIQRLHNEVFIKQEPDDGPLSDEYRAYLQAKAKIETPNKHEFDQSIF